MKEQIWRLFAEERLRRYPLQAESARNLRTQLDEARQRLRTADAGGLVLTEEERLSLSALAEELEHRLSETERSLAVTRGGLSVLDEEERAVLKGFYMTRGGYRADRLSRQLNYGRSALYEHRDAALRRFTEAVYGCV